MTVASLSFLSFAAGFVLLFHLSRGWVRNRLVYTAGNLLFLWLATANAVAAACFLGYVLAIWGATKLTRRWREPLAFAAMVGLLLLLFGILKRYEFLSFVPLLGQVPVIVGLSYALIRSLQLLFDLRDEAADPPDLITLFNFLAAWPSLISGPIQRYQDSMAEQRAMPEFRLDAQVVDTALRRIARGYLFLMVFSQFFKMQWLNLHFLDQEVGAPLALSGSQAVFLVHLYFDFAGYTDIVIGIALLIGLRLPENFNRPWMATSFLDFWARWHMSMSNWFRTYVFNALLLTMMTRWRSPAMSTYCGVAAFFLTFFLVGLWHGTTVTFVICGLMLGLGASVNQFYRIWLRSRLGKARFNALVAKPWYILLCSTLGLAYVCFSATPLWMTLAELRDILGKLGISGLLVSGIGLIVLCAICVPALRLLSSIRIPALPVAPRWSTALQAGAVILLVELYQFVSPTTGGGLFYGQF